MGKLIRTFKMYTKGNLIMNNYCIHLKKRKNKPYCNILKKELTLSECSAVNSAEHCREYKTKITKNSFYKNDIKISKMKSKSNKLAKLERNRKSIFTDDLEHCYLCGKAKYIC